MFKDTIMFCSFMMAAILLCAGDTLAAVYTWTDSEGRVHYSDKKSSKKAKQASTGVKLMPDAKYVEVNTPDVYTGRYIGEWLSITPSTHKLVDGFAGDLEKRAHFYFGGDCVSPTSLTVPDLFLRYPLAINQTYTIDQAVRSQFKKYAYRIISSSLDQRSQYKGKPRHHLSAKLVDININACAEKIHKGKQTGLLDDFHAGAFNKSNVWMKLEWTIVDKETNKIYVKTFTEGSVDKVDGRDRSMSYTFRAALDRSIENFLVSDIFLRYLDDNQSVAETKKVVRTPALPMPEKGLLSKVSNFFKLSYFKAAKFARAYSLIIPLKTRLTEYYFMSDAWPENFSDLGVDTATLHEPDLIKTVELYDDGVIVVLLDEQAFGEGQYFQLTPTFDRRMASQRIDWGCGTSLDEAYQVDSCVRH